MKKRDVEVLFCFEPYDELVLLQLREFDRKQLTSVEKDMRQDSGADKSTDADAGMPMHLFLIAFRWQLKIPFCFHRKDWSG